jgi:hypothetical protein
MSSLLTHIEFPGQQGFGLVTINMLLDIVTHECHTRTTSVPGQSWEKSFLSNDLLRPLLMGDLP